jgi:hypothetical protein
MMIRERGKMITKMIILITTISTIARCAVLLSNIKRTVAGAAGGTRAK